MASTGKDTQHTVRHSQSFEKRYCMKKSEWTTFKREKRSQGLGREIFEKMCNAYRTFIKNIKVVDKEYYFKVRQK